MTDPVDRHLTEARALAEDPELPDDLRAELVVHSCREAIEAAAHERARRARLTRGESPEDVEAVLSLARTTHAKVALAVFGAPGRGDELYRRLNEALGGWASNVLRACKTGAEAGTDLRRLVTNTGTLARWLTR
jgi:hypothetical protein